MTGKSGIALLLLFATREYLWSTMSTIYSLGGEVDDENTTVMNRMRAEMIRKNGKPMYDAALGFSLMILFYAFAMQCMSTLTTTYRETRMALSCDSVSLYDYTSVLIGIYCLSII